MTNRIEFSLKKITFIIFLSLQIIICLSGQENQDDKKQDDDITFFYPEEIKEENPQKSKFNLDVNLGLGYGGLYNLAEDNNREDFYLPDILIGLSASPTFKPLPWFGFGIETGFYFDFILYFLSYGKINALLFYLPLDLQVKFIILDWVSIELFSGVFLNFIYAEKIEPFPYGIGINNGVSFYFHFKNDKIIQNSIYLSIDLRVYTYGSVKDWHLESVYQGIQPLIILGYSIHYNG